jgi:hypothetical protein
MTRHSFAPALALALLLATSASFAQSDAAASSATSLAPGQAKTCSLNFNSLPLVLQGRNGFCGKGSYVTFRVRRMNDFFIEQLCDLQRPVTRTPTGEEPGDDRVACFSTGEVSEPNRTSRGATVVMDGPSQDQKAP